MDGRRSSVCKQKQGTEALVPVLDKDCWFRILQKCGCWDWEVAPTKFHELQLKLVCKDFFELVEELQQGEYAFQIYPPEGEDWAEPFSACAKFIRRRHSAMKSIQLILGRCDSMAIYRVLDAVAHCPALQRFSLWLYPGTAVETLGVYGLPNSLNWFQLVSQTSGVEILIADLNRLETLQLYPFGAVQMSQVTGLTSLTSLSIEDIHSSSDLAGIERLANLEYLRLTHIREIDTDLGAMLMSLPKLQEAIIEDLQTIDDDSITDLDNLDCTTSHPCLKDVTITAADCSPEGLRSATSREAISSLLIVTDDKIKDISMPINWLLVRVKKLQLPRFKSITLDWLEVLQAPQLEALCIETETLVLENMQVLLDMSPEQKERLTLQICLFSPEGFDTVRAQLERAGFVVEQYTYYGGYGQMDVQEWKVYCHFTIRS